jgi:hypothetical protein
VMYHKEVVKAAVNIALVENEKLLPCQAEGCPSCSTAIIVNCAQDCEKVVRLR